MLTLYGVADVAMLRRGNFRLLAAQIAAPPPPQDAVSMIRAGFSDAAMKDVYVAGSATHGPLLPTVSCCAAGLDTQERRHEGDTQSDVHARLRSRQIRRQFVGYD